MANLVYLDNASTTRPSGAVVAAVGGALDSCWGNPSSLHSLGIRAEQSVETVRKALAEALGCREKEIFFTSGGTEANNTAVLGAAGAMHRRGRRVITTAAEHSSTLAAMEELSRRGFEVVYIKPDVFGNISIDDIAAAVTPDTVLISVMLVNNETGARFPVEKIRRAAEKKGAPALIHCDAVQAFGKLPLDVGSLSVDLLSVSAHKIHGPKGVGALYRSSRARVLPLHFGGEQQSGFRPGTEPVALIAGFGAAVNEIDTGLIPRFEALKTRLADGLRHIEGAVINSPEDAAPFIVNISVPGFRSETLLHFLDSRGVIVSSGSACAKGKKSHVLSAMGLPSARLDSALRISFSRDTTENDVSAFLSALGDATRTLKGTDKK